MASTEHIEQFNWNTIGQKCTKVLPTIFACVTHAKEQTNLQRATLVNVPVEDTFLHLHMDILGPLTKIKTRPKIPITGLIQQISRGISIKNSRIKRNN